MHLTVDNCQLSSGWRCFTILFYISCHNAMFRPKLNPCNLITRRDSPLIIIVLLLYYYCCCNDESINILSDVCVMLHYEENVFLTVNSVYYCLLSVNCLLTWNATRYWVCYILCSFLTRQKDLCVKYEEGKRREIVERRALGSDWM
jgi:hypothetical protein